MTDDAHGIDRDHQIASLTEIIGALATTVAQLSDRIQRLEKADRQQRRSDAGDSHQPAPWVWFPPPAAAEDDPDTTDGSWSTVDNFVAWYNITYLGVDGSRAQPIPPCWRQHPGLAMEIALLPTAGAQPISDPQLIPAKPSTGITNGDPASPTASYANGFIPIVLTVNTGPLA